MKGKRITCRWTAGVIFLLLPQLFLSAQNTNPARKAARALELLESGFPRQKVFIHTDKGEYIAGETLWLKAYLVDATTHLLSDFSNTLMLEMYNTSGEAVASHLLKLENGTAHASVPLLDSLPEGNYLIRSYTNWMRNFGEEGFFEKEIFVHNPSEENFIKRRSIRRNRSFNRELAEIREQYQFAVFPEGGRLIAGSEGRVAFKAADQLGAGVQASGRIINGRGQEILAFETSHKGMGVFSILPLPDMEYQALVTFPDGSEMRVPVPVATQGYAMRVDPEETHLDVRILSNLNHQAMGIPPEVYLVAHVRGQAHFIGGGPLENGRFETRIPLAGFPDGICQLTLFDANERPVAARSCFIHANGLVAPHLEATFTPLRNNSLGGHMELLAEWPEAPSEGGSYSLVVLGAGEPFPDLLAHIGSSLLLTSELETPVEEPRAYFSGENGPDNERLDLLMLTQAWKKYDWEKLFEGKIPEVQYGLADKLSVRGKVNASSSRQQTGEVLVSMSVGQDSRDQLSTTTDERGNFVFSGLDYTGTFTAEFIAGRDHSGRSLEVELVSRPLPDIDYPLSLRTKSREVLSRGADWSRVSKPRITLSERTGRTDVPDRQSSIYGEPDQVIYMEDIREDYSSLLGVIRGRVVGLTETPSGFMLRGPSSIRSSTEPLYVIDGVIVHPSNFLHLSPREVERIEVLKGPKTAIFGVRGGNGVLIAYTRTSLAGSRFSHTYTLYGYHEPDGFYASKISTEEYLDNGIAYTHYWNPSLRADEAGRVRLRFPVNELSAHTRIIIQGLDHEGRITFQEIRLKN